MYFQSLPNQYEKISEHRWKIAVTFLIGVTFLLWISIFTFQPELTLEQTNEKINQSKQLKEVDSLCENLPKPENFQFIKKVISGNSRTTAISYYYESNLGYEKIRTFYLDWFNQNNWKLKNQSSLEFIKNNFTIHISGYQSGLQYIIHCAAES